MKAKEALLNIRDIIESYGDERVRRSFSLEFHRRLLVLQLIQEYCREGGIVVDLGASPFIISCALKLMGYEVVACDYDPQQYSSIAEAFNVKVFKCDLERDSLDMPSESTDCAILSEVIEHLNPYYVSRLLAEVNRILKYGGTFILTTPNIASLFRRIKLLLGKQPQYRYHVHEYTKSEVEKLLIEHGLKILKSYYTEVNDLTFIDAAPEEYLNLRSYWGMLKITIKRPTCLNILRTTVYPIVKFVPSLRMHIVVVSKKEIVSGIKKIERW
ncbi:MAG: class I SAM-dependent methyltransferase [Sulfolobales archaeon]